MTNNQETFNTLNDALYDNYLSLLRVLKKERRFRNKFVTDSCTPNIEVPEWVVYERQQLLSCINESRHQLKLTELTELDVKKIQDTKDLESTAHSCVELVYSKAN